VIEDGGSKACVLDDVDKIRAVQSSIPRCKAWDQGDAVAVEAGNIDVE